MTPSKAFKITALLEALSWCGLIVGMFFKWIIQSTELGVKIFGPIHGVVFLSYVASLVWVATSRKWSATEAALGFVSAFPPFMTLWFEKRAERLGLINR